MGIVILQGFLHPMDTYYAGMIRRTTTEEIDVGSLRDMCDAYHDPRDCEVGGTRTVFNVKGLRLTDNMSNRCLKFYNQKNSKNFNLEEVVKFNFLHCEFYCMTFRAREAESNECHYFRGVVYSYARRDVLLCEIKDDGGTSIPPEHDESYDPMSSIYDICCSSDDDDDLLTIGSENVDRGSDAGLGDGLAVGFADVNRGSDVGSIGVPNAP